MPVDADSGAARAVGVVDMVGGVWHTRSIAFTVDCSQDSPSLKRFKLHGWTGNRAFPLVRAMFWTQTISHAVVWLPTIYDVDLDHGLFDLGPGLFLECASPP